MVAVADIFEKDADNITIQFGDNYRSIEEISNSDDVDAVLICTPTITHANLIEKVARAGKAILCEKPIDFNVGRVIACLDVVKETNTTLMVDFNRRFDPHFVVLKEIITAGKIEMINIISRDPGAPPAEYIKSSGSIFKDITIHDFDLARFF